MNLREQILQEHTRKNCQKIIDWVGDDLSRFNELFNLFLHDEYRVTQRAAWPVSYCVMGHPEFIKNNFKKLINNLQKPGIHDAIKRNTLRLLPVVPIPEKYEGIVMDICFKYVETLHEAVAIKSFAITILGKFAKKYPEIIPELKYLIEDHVPHQTAAFKSRANKILKEFSSL